MPDVKMDAKLDVAGLDLSGLDKMMLELGNPASDTRKSIDTYLAGQDRWIDALKRGDLTNQGTLKPGTLPPPIGRIERKELCERVEYAMSLQLPTDMHCINTAREWAVIGGGPSINNHIGTIRALKHRGVAIVSVNKSHDWLLGHGIVPWAHVLLDPKDWVADYVKSPRMDVRYFIASQCHRNTFDRFKDYPVFLWHAGQDFHEDQITEPDSYLKTHWGNSNWRVTPGATTVGLRTPMLGHHMNPGADRFHMIGFDSSRGTAGQLHGYEKAEAQDASQGVQKLTHRDRVYHFATNSHMARQFVDFDKFMMELDENYKTGKLRKGFNLKFYGSGLLPFYAAMLGLHAEASCNANPEKVGGFTAVGIKKQPEISCAPVMTNKADLVPLTGLQMLTLDELRAN